MGFNSGFKGLKSVQSRHTWPLPAALIHGMSVLTGGKKLLDCVWNVMAHAKKPDFVFRRNGRVHLNRQGRQFSRLLAAEVCTSAVVMLDAPCSKVVWRVLATHSIRQFPLHFPCRASPSAVTFQLDSTTLRVTQQIIQDYIKKRDQVMYFAVFTSNQSQCII